MATLLKRFYEDSLAQASYMLACTRTKEAIVVDANRDCAQYEAAAVRHGVRIAHVTETHIHADYVSGSRELARRTGAKLYLSAEGGADWQYEFAASDGATLLHGGEVIPVGQVRVDVVHTPGHTPEHLTFVVTEPGAAAAPMGAFTGDFVFVGDVGRPDLLEKTTGAAGAMRIAAADLFESLRQFKSFPDYLQIWPGHGAGSPCGKALGAVPQTTVGYERLMNWAFAEPDAARFAERVLKGQPEPPRYFAVMKRVNRAGPEPLGERREPRLLSANEMNSAPDGRATLLDVRSAAAYAQGHVAGSVNVPAGGSFPIWAGSAVPYDRPVVLITASAAGEDAASVTRQLGLIGLDDVVGYVGWEAIPQGMPQRVTAMPQIRAAELRAVLGRNSLQVVDVRNGYEWDAGHIDGAQHIPLAQLIDRADELDPKQPVVVHCEMGGRSAVAASVLEAQGFRDVRNLEGGYRAWQEAASD
jgi:hydroxyacylglutathione hydrolase